MIFHYLAERLTDENGYLIGYGRIRKVALRTINLPGYDRFVSTVDTKYPKAILVEGDWQIVEDSNKKDNKQLEKSEKIIDREKLKNLELIELDDPKVLKETIMRIIRCLS